MARLTIEISEPAWQKLLDLAHLERRSSRDHAAVLLERALGVRGPEPGRGDPEPDGETPT